MSEIKIEEKVPDIFTAFFEFTVKERWASFKELNKRAQKGGVIFVGDSITQGFPINEILSSDKPMYNRGINGDTTTGVLEKLKDEVFDLLPKKVFLLIGTNDLGGGVPPEEVAQRIEVICRSIQETVPDTELFVESIYPVNEVDFADEVPIPIISQRSNEAIQLTNKGIKEVTDRLKVQYINLYPNLSDLTGKLDKRYSYDGLHLNTEGYYVVADELRKYL